MSITLIRIAIIGIFLLIKAVKGFTGKLDTLIFILLIIRLISDFVTYFVEDSNIVHYSILSVFDNVVLVLLFYFEIRKKWILFFGIGSFLLLNLLYFNTDQSMITLLGYKDSYELLRPIGVHQFFDLCSWNNLIIVVLTFSWLSSTLSKTSLKKDEIIKRFIYIFTFLTYYGGSFFTLAFARLGLPGTDYWSNIWYTIYIPLYFLFILALIVGLLWKPIP